MKLVTIFLPSLRGGGAERSFVTIANELHHRGIHVHVVLGQKIGPFIQSLNSVIPIFDLKSPELLRSIFPLRRYLLKHKPDILLSAMPTANTVAVIARSISKVNTKIILSERNSIIVNGYVKRWFAKKVKHLIYSKADAIVTVSHDIAKQLSDFTGLDESRMVTIYNPVVTEELTSKASEPLDNSWFNTKDKPIILGVGRLTAQKNFSLLLDSFAELRRKLDARLIILGEGPLRSKLEAQCETLGISQHVSMPGFVENPFSYMKQADLFVQSSGWEGLPGVLIQAMACGTRVLCTESLGGAAEILEFGKWGKIVPSSSICLAVAMLEELHVEKMDYQERLRLFETNTIISNYEKLITKIHAEASTSEAPVLISPN